MCDSIYKSETPLTLIKRIGSNIQNNQKSLWNNIRSKLSNIGEQSPYWLPHTVKVDKQSKILLVLVLVYSGMWLRNLILLLTNQGKFRDNFAWVVVFLSLLTIQNTLRWWSLRNLSPFVKNNQNDVHKNSDP